VLEKQIEKSRNEKVLLILDNAPSLTQAKIN